jgi:electron transfer flavoprotein alpha subunit
MGDILVFLQHNEGLILKASASALTAALEIKEKHAGGEIVVVCLGPGAKKAAELAASYGIKKAYVNESPALEKYIAPPYSAALKACFEISGARYLCLASTSTGKDLAPRVAACLDLGQASDIIAVNNDKTFRRPMYAGDIFADVRLLTEKAVITVRASAFSGLVAGGSGEITIEEFDFQIPGFSFGEVASYEISKAERPELGDAEVVVSGGRALQSAENFEKYVFPLADVLGAGVGASRAAVDAGYAPNDWQVGQTGKIVAPGLYIAVGISGAIQHLAGMKDSKVIVAINKDPEAPIFEIADYALVADLYAVVPELVEKIKSIKAA